MKNPYISARISVGEFLDKITILQIKTERIKDFAKRRNIDRELAILNEIRAESLDTVPELSGLEDELKKVNETIWNLEDEIRDHEHRNDFGSSFVSLARSIYRANDRRAALKRQINELMGSNIVEEKSYTEY
ncbi:MAG: DUF6165 family protein [Desulfomonilaceae bacterium]